MAVHGLRSTGTCVSNGLLVSGINLISQKFSPGDVAWTKIHNDIWWPAQVVDETRIGAKAKKKYKDQILVRLYGSYEYLYVDPLRCNMEFENVSKKIWVEIVKQDNITVKKAFQKSLEKELSQLLSGSNSKRKAPHCGENTPAESPKGKQQKKEKTARNHKGIASSALRSSRKQNGVSLQQEEEDDARHGAANNANTNTKQDEARKPRINKKYSRRTLKTSSRRRPNTGNQDTNETEMHEAHGVQSTKRDYLSGSLLNSSMDKVKSKASNMLEMKQLGSGQLKLNDSEQVKVNSLDEASKEKNEKQVEYEICRDKFITPVIVKQYALRKHKNEDVKKGSGANVRSQISKGKGKGKENHELRLLDSAVIVIGDRLRNRTKKNDPQSLNSSSGVPKNKDIKQDDSGKLNAVGKIDTVSASRAKNIKQSGSRQKKDKDTKEPQNRSPNSAPEVFLRISPRRTKVMQSLGLIAPSGSPFLRSGRL